MDANDFGMVVLRNDGVVLTSYPFEAFIDFPVQLPAQVQTATIVAVGVSISTFGT